MRNFAPLNPDPFVIGQVTADNGDGSYDYLIDGQTYSGKPAAFPQVAGQYTHLGFLDRNGRRQPIALDDNQATQTNYIMAPNLPPAPTVDAPWGMLGGTTNRAHFAAGPSVIPALDSGTGLLTDCTQIAMQGITSAIGCVSPGYGLLAVASSAYVSFFSNGSGTWMEYYLSPSGSYQADIQQILCSASTVYVVEYTKPTNTGGGGGGTAGA